MNLYKAICSLTITSATSPIPKSKINLDFNLFVTIPSELRRFLSYTHILRVVSDNTKNMHMNI